MKIAVLGTGYVGLVAGACFAHIGHSAVCVDVDEKKIQMLKKGKCPIYEPGLEEILKKTIKEGKISFTTELEDAVKDAKAVFIAVGTPEKDDGRADLQYVMQVAQSLAPIIDEDTLIVDKSTVPVGTGKKVKEILSKGTDKKFHVVSNPEFLREGCAVKDFMKPDRLVVGLDSEYAKKVMDELYAPLKPTIVYTNIESAEITKYASNAFLATKISFINEISRLCEKTGANVEDVAIGMGLDSRIGKHFLRAGSGWGGSCFPKDVKALIMIGKDNNVDFKISQAADDVNEDQKLVPARKVQAKLGDLRDKKIALLGLAFKPETDDMRNATSIEVTKYLTNKGASVTGYDPIAIENAKNYIERIEFVKDPLETVKNADAVIVLTEWDIIKDLDYTKILEEMKGNVLIDGRNCLNRKTIEKIGFIYEGIGI